ncbi:site-specific integrase [Paenibacillus alvei]|uniref:tyrosine-type recombinase/integrase n=1 Tax=Paenibacillus alvei TaxID=44250 RepID=UPI002280B900|nr:site-specific integrase [Paenibacillus alvei]MCY9737943.1 site-specific integrase [Paenibacillus alvei]
MKGHVYKPKCKCKDKDGKSLSAKKCNCGASWAYIVDVGTNPVTGQRKQKKKGGFKTKTEAQDHLAIFIAENSQGTYVEEKKISFEDYAVEWIKEYELVRQVKPGTVRVRNHEIGNLNKYMAKLRLKDITSDIYQKSLFSMKNELELADNTIDGIHRTGRMIFKRAVEKGIIKNDPTAAVTPPKSIATVEQLENEKQLPNYLEKEELGLLLKYCKERGLEQDYTIFWLLSYSGMRVGELCALKWRNIDLENGTIKITKTYYNPTNNVKNFLLVPPKTKKSIRKIIIDDDTISRLKEHRIWQDVIKNKYKDSYFEDDFVFVVTPNHKSKDVGYPIYIKLVENRMDRLLKLSKLNTDLTPHSLRHTHVSLLAEAGVSLEQIMDRIGHSDDETTTMIYLHITEPRKKEASQKFQELMRSLPKSD